MYISRNKVLIKLLALTAYDLYQHQHQWAVLSNNLIYLIDYVDSCLFLLKRSVANDWTSDWTSDCFIEFAISYCWMFSMAMRLNSCVNPRDNGLRMFCFHSCAIWEPVLVGKNWKNVTVVRSLVAVMECHMEQALGTLVWEFVHGHLFANMFMLVIKESSGRKSLTSAEPRRYALNHAVTFMVSNCEKLLVASRYFGKNCANCLTSV